MDYAILHEIPGRIRVHCPDVPQDDENAAAVEELLTTLDGIVFAFLNTRTGNLLVRYSRLMPREHVLAVLDVLEPSDWAGFGAHAVGTRPDFFAASVMGIVREAAKTAMKWLFLPPCFRCGLIVLDALPYVWKGVRALVCGRLDVAVLDGAAMTILAIRRDFSAARTILWMFRAADALEEWTREQSRMDLADALALKVDTVWVETSRGEIKRPLSEVRPGDVVIVGTGMVVPVDGTVASGEAMVNQSVLTGESAAVHKAPGSSVFAGTVVDEGRLTVRVVRQADDTRLSGIIRFIEDSEQVKAGVQSRLEKMADSIVPFSLLLAGIVLAVTRSPLRASAVLMVDYSCAIRMSTPLTILNAIQEGVKAGILMKGGKHLESLAAADCLVLDKTGTLTRAQPKVAKVVAFAGWTPAEVLRTAACIEEHFPHPVGRAVVKRAEEKNLSHRERHAKPEYILAHGIASHIEGRRILVGSSHFILDDNNVPLTADAALVMEEQSGLGRSLLFMAYDDRLVGMLAIEDPVREDALETLSALTRGGVREIHMLTGDGRRTAETVAGNLGIGSVHAGLLPVDKVRIVKDLKAAGRRVMFVGDGVNDSPALSAADVGVSLKEGADIAREVAGVVLLDGRLSDLVIARTLSRMTLSRVRWQFRFIVGLNSVLIGLGLFGVVSPRLAALMHNLGTVLVTVNSIKKVLPEMDVPVEPERFPVVEQVSGADVG